MDSGAGLLLAVLFGAFGLGYFVYGRRQRSVMPFLSGVALMVFPYFVGNVYLILLIGIVLLFIPYFIRL